MNCQVSISCSIQKEVCLTFVGTLCLFLQYPDVNHGWSENTFIFRTKSCFCFSVWNHMHLKLVNLNRIQWWAYQTVGDLKVTCAILSGIQPLPSWVPAGYVVCCSSYSTSIYYEVWWFYFLSAFMMMFGQIPVEFVAVDSWSKIAPGLTQHLEEPLRAVLGCYTEVTGWATW